MLDAGDIQLLKTYGRGPYADALKKIEQEIEDVRKRVNERMGVKESETGLAPPNLVRVRTECIHQQVWLEVSSACATPKDRAILHAISSSPTWLA